MGRALYRTYRSRSLDEIVGQDHITQLLKAAIAADAVAHAYLLTGPRGVGKTSIARIIAHEINALPYTDEASHLDIIEIDAASNNGVEDVRDLREKVHIAPSSAKKKVYIIDEVHMLSKAAFNALLKTLEEPPEHVVFILATTDAEKLPQTIISRVQRFNFRTIPPKEVAEHLRTIAESESIAIDDAALMRIAEHGEGSFRDSIGLLDQLKNSVAPEAITLDTVNITLGATDHETIIALLQAHEQQNLPQLVTTLNNLEASGISAKVIRSQLIDAIVASPETTATHLSLLDRLTQLSVAQYPYLRLLVALSKDMAAPAKDPVASPQPTHTPPASQSSSAAKRTSPAPSTTKAASSSHTSTAKSAPKTSSKKPISKFSWLDFIATVKQEAVAIATLLNQSDYTLEYDTLTIYTKQAFRAKRLSSAKYLSAINYALETLGHGGLKVEISPEAKPSDDSSVAAVTAIMGGGEEISVDGE